MINLLDEFNTRYFMAGQLPAMNELKKRIIAEQETLNIAGAHICFNVMEVIIDLVVPNGLTVVDQEFVKDGEVIPGDAERNAYFAEQKRRFLMRQQLKQQRIIRLVVPETEESIMSSIESLKEGTYYTTYTASTSMVAYAFIVQALRPEITLDMGTCVSVFFKKLSACLPMRSRRWDELYVLTGNTFFKKNVSEMSNSEYFNYVSTQKAVIPAVLGAEQIASIDASGEFTIAPEWKRAWNVFYDDLKGSFVKPRPKIADFL